MKLLSILFLGLYVLGPNNAWADPIDLFKYDGGTEDECKTLGGWIGRYDGNRAAGNVAEKEKSETDQMTLIRNNCKANGFDIFETRYKEKYHYYSNRNIDNQ